MENILLIIVGVIASAIIGWLIAKVTSSKGSQALKDDAEVKFNSLDKEFASYKASTSSELVNLQDKKAELLKQIDELNKTIKDNGESETTLIEEKAALKSDLDSANQTISEKVEEIKSLKLELKAITDSFNDDKTKLATALADNNALKEKLETQKQEIEKLNEKFNTEFENIANRILDSKTEKFTELNKTNLQTILEPLGKNITDFKTKVEEVYDKESKERFSLGEKVKELAQLNQVVSEEARNLTKALKGEAKTQGRWGEVILENILEKSGLRKGEEYFMEYQLFDADGKALRSESEGKKMRPDALIKYPDNRHVIIDSKVSLNAFVRFVESAETEQQKLELENHISAIKSHINDLSKKAYDDYDKTLDFVMMFIPNEPAYITAMQGDPDLWNYAYERRILLISPTNLIAALKLIVDLWKREYQNQNAIEIADRGAKLYDKFVGFVENLKDVGQHIEKAQNKYNEAYKQLSTGNDNLVLQATKLKSLGVKAKKELPQDLLNTSLNTELNEKQE